MIFLAETFSEITYHQLIKDLNQKTECFNHFFYKDVYSFYLNLLFAITQNQDLVLVDTDWSLEEISNYNISPDERIAIENPVFPDVVSTIVDPGFRSPFLSAASMM